MKILIRFCKRIDKIAVTHQRHVLCSPSQLGRLHWLHSANPQHQQAHKSATLTCIKTNPISEQYSLHALQWLNKIKTLPTLIPYCLARAANTQLKDAFRQKILTLTWRQHLLPKNSRRQNQARSGMGRRRNTQTWRLCSQDRNLATMGISTKIYSNQDATLRLSNKNLYRIKKPKRWQLLATKKSWTRSSQPRFLVK